MPEPQPRAGQAAPGRSKVDFPTPDVRDTILSDVLTSNLADYAALLVGSQSPDFETNPDHVLVKQIPIDWQNVARIYAKDRAAQNAYNAAITYSGESSSHPIYTRDYLERRSDYGAAGALSTLTGVVRAAVTNGGSGYDQATVQVNLSGGAGTGAEITAIVSNTGGIIALAVTAEGTGYTSAPTISIFGGSGATGTVAIQAATAKLVHEETLRMADSPLDGLYVLVRRIYETLPGPWIPSTRIDDDSVIVTQRTRRRVAVDITSVETLATGVWTKTTKQGDDANVALEVEETRAIPGNEIYERGYDRESGAAQTTYRQKVALLTAAPLALGATKGGQIVVVSAVVDDLESQLVGTLRSICRSQPKTLTNKKATSEHGGGIATVTRRWDILSTPDPVGGLMILSDEVTDLANGLFYHEIVEVAGAAWPILEGTMVDETTGVAIDYTKQVVAAGTTGGVVGNVFTEVQPLDKWRSVKITSEVDAGSLPSPVSYQVTAQVKDADTYSTSEESATSGYAVDRGYYTSKVSGASGPKFCTATEYYVLAAGLAGVPLGTVRRVVSDGFTGLHDKYENSGDQSYAKVFIGRAPTSDVITGTTLDVNVTRLRFGVYKVVKITA